MEQDTSHDKGDPSPARADITQEGYSDRVSGMGLLLCSEQKLEPVKNYLVCAKG